MENIKVSFIIPAYNAQTYIARCLDSVLMQRIEKEIIVINDGSTDATLDILQEYARNNRCIRILSQQNKGQSVARNIGIAEARGNYLCFMDSDDYYFFDFARQFYHLCIKYKLDIIRGWYAKVTEDGQKIPVVFHVGYENKVISTYDFLSRSVRERAVEVVPVTGFIKRDYVRNNRLRFPEGYFYEDQLFYLEMLLCKEPGRIMQTACCFYAYQINQASTTHVFTDNKYQNMIVIMKKQQEFLNSLTIKAKYKRAAYHACSYTMCHLITIYLRLETHDQSQGGTELPLRIKIISLLYANNIRDFFKILTFLLQPSLLMKLYHIKRKFHADA